MRRKIRCGLVWVWGNLLNEFWREDKELLAFLLPRRWFIWLVMLDYECDEEYKKKWGLK